VLNWMERSRAAALLAVEPPELGEFRADWTALRAAQSQLRDDDVNGDEIGTPAHARAALAASEQAVIEDVSAGHWRARPVAAGRPPS